MLDKIPFLSKRFKVAELLQSVPSDLPPVEFTTDVEWETVEVLPENSSLLIDGNGKIFKMVNGRWVNAPEIKDIRINTHW